MSRPVRRRLLKALPAGALALATGWPTARAQSASSYPDHPLKLVVPFPPGALTDALGRLVAERLRASLGQPVIVDNRAGAGTLLGASLVARGAPDGYQLLVATTTTLAISPALFASPPAVPSDFTGVAMIGNVSLLLVTRPGLDVATLPQLVALMRAKPDQLTFGSPSNGTMHHLTVEMIKAQEKVTARHIPYQGSGAALTDLMSGRIDFMFLDVVAALPQVQAKTIVPIAVLASRRLPALPAIPTVVETYPAIDVQAWQSIVAPAKTPPAIVQKLNADLNRTLSDPASKEALARVGVEGNPLSTADLNRLIATDATRFAELVRRLGLKVG